MAELRGMASMPAPARFLLLLMLLGGIVTMHAVAFTPGPDHAAHYSVAAPEQHHSTGAHADPTAPPCSGDDCGNQHTGLHGCVSIMTAVAVIAGLTLLYWIGTNRERLLAPKWRRNCRRRQRAPPWTVFSLHELSILRV